MSGSSDSEIDVKIGATATEFEASCKAATTATQALKAAIDGLTASMQAATASVTKTTPAMDALRNASAASSQALNTTNTAATAASRSLRDVIDQATGVSRGLKDAGDSAEVFRRGLGDASNEVKQLRGFFEDENESAGHAAHGTSGLTREIIVLAHETVSGNFSRIPGSLMVMAELMGNISLKTLGWAGAIGVATYAVYELVSAWHEVEQAVQAAQGAQITIGTWSPQSESQIRDMAARLRDKGGLSNTEAAQVAASFQTMGGAAAQYRDRIADLSHAYATLEHLDQGETAKHFAGMFNDGADAVLKWGQSTHRIEGETANAIKRTIDAMDSKKAMEMEIAALEARFGASGAAAAASRKNIQAPIGILAEAADSPVPVEVPTPPTHEQATIGKPGTPAPSPDDLDRAAAVEKHSQAVEKLIALQGQRQHIQEAADRGEEDAQEALATIDREIAATHTTLQQQQHEATTARLRGELVEAKDNADKKLEITRQLDAEETRYNGASSTAAMAAHNQVMVAQQAADEQHLRMRLAQLGQEEAAAQGNVGALMAIEDRKLAVLREAGKQGTLEYQNELNRRTALERQAGDEAVQLRLAKLRGDQEAARGDYATQLAIQDQIIAMVREHYGEGTVQLQAELSKQQRLHAEELQQTAQLAVQQLEQQRRGLEEQLRADMQHTDAVRQEGEISIGAARDQQLRLIETYRSSAAEILRIEAQKATGIRTLSEQVTRRQEELVQQSAIAVQRVNDRAAQETQRAWTSTSRSIAGTFASETTQMLAGQRTFVQVVQSLEERLVESAIAWAARKALAWIGGEIAQTAASRAQAAIRGGADAAASAPSLALMLAKWLGLETSKTSATVAESAVRTAAEAAASVGGQTPAMLAAIAEIERQAAVAAAGAYAATAAIPVVGPGMAPAAAAEAYAAVQSFAPLASFAVGAWRLPGNTIAQLHRDEMVVPATFADGLRNAVGGGGGGGFGGGGDTFNIMAMDGQSALAFFNKHAGTMARVVSRYSANNARVRPAY